MQHKVYLIFKPFSNIFPDSLLVPGWKPKGLIISPPSVRPSVGAERHIWKTALTIFLKFGMKLGANRGSNVTRPLFWKKNPYFWENGEVIVLVGIFSFFWTLRINRSNGFSKILPKCVNKWPLRFGKKL